jgi:hypothetical protein
MEWSDRIALPESIPKKNGLSRFDNATRSVRRVTLQADDLPESSSTHASLMSVDYDYVAINGHDYLVPVSAQMRLTIGRHQQVLNTIEFRNYSRFRSNMRILGFIPVDGPVKPEKR